MGWVIAAAPWLVPVVIGLLTAILGGVFLTASRLRRDLAADVQILGALPGPGRAGNYLNTSVQHRVIRLVGLTRYPALAATDLLGLAGVAVSVGWAILIVLDLNEYGAGDAVSTAMPPFFTLGVSYVSGRFFYRGWSRRATARFRFLSPLLDGDEVRDLAILLGALNMAMGPVSIALITVPTLVLVLATVEALALPLAVTAVLIAAFAIASVPVLIFPIGRNELAKVTRTYVSEHDKRASHPRSSETPAGALPANEDPSRRRRSRSLFGRGRRAAARTHAR